MLFSLADEGRTVICTLHETSTVLFSNIDNVLLLAHGGRMLYSRHGRVFPRGRISLLGPWYTTSIRLQFSNCGLDIASVDPTSVAAKADSTKTWSSNVDKSELERWTP
jgi:hypothetical protein